MFCWDSMGHNFTFKATHWILTQPFFHFEEILVNGTRLKNNTEWDDVR